MDEKRFRQIISELKYYELSSTERQFVETVERHLGQEGRLTDQQESELEGLYQNKVMIVFDPSLPLNWKSWDLTGMCPVPP
jgi:hypothetical protein